MMFSDAKISTFIGTMANQQMAKNPKDATPETDAMQSTMAWNAEHSTTGAASWPITMFADSMGSFLSTAIRSTSRRKSSINAAGNSRYE